LAARGSPPSVEEGKDFRLEEGLGKEESLGGCAFHPSNVGTFVGGGIPGGFPVVFWVVTNDFLEAGEEGGNQNKSGKGRCSPASSKKGGGDMRPNYAIRANTTGGSGVGPLEDRVLGGGGVLTPCLLGGGELKKKTCQKGKVVSRLKTRQGGLGALEVHGCFIGGGPKKVGLGEGVAEIRRPSHPKARTKFGP